MICHDCKTPISIEHKNRYTRPRGLSFTWQICQPCHEKYEQKQKEVKDEKQRRITEDDQ